jgi:hypothetical protein
MIVMPFAGRRPLKVPSWLFKHFRKEWDDHDEEIADSG